MKVSLIKEIAIVITDVIVSDKMREMSIAVKVLYCCTFGVWLCAWAFIFAITEKRVKRERFPFLTGFKIDKF